MSLCGCCCRVLYLIFYVLAPCVLVNLFKVLLFFTPRFFKLSIETQMVALIGVDCCLAIDFMMYMNILYALQSALYIFVNIFL